MKKYYYEIQYMSSYFLASSDYNIKTVVIESEKELQENSYIVVEKIHQGFFLGKILRTAAAEKDCKYRYTQEINLDKAFERIEKEKRKEELEKQMEEEYKRIDKMSKWEFYASKDEFFNKIFTEYKNL